MEHIENRVHELTLSPDQVKCLYLQALSSKGVANRLHLSMNHCSYHILCSVQSLHLRL